MDPLAGNRKEALSINVRRQTRLSQLHISRRCRLDRRIFGAVDIRRSRIERDHQLFRVRRYIYGLPDAGRAFYEQSKSKLQEEGYTMSEIDQCLFYRIQRNEETYIVIFVDDSFVYSNRKEYIREYEQKMRKHFEITTDPEAESFLGVTFTYDEERNCKLGQKKLLTKLFNENPPLKTGKRWRPATLPY